MLDGRIYPLNLVFGIPYIPNYRALYLGVLSLLISLDVHLLVLIDILVLSYSFRCGSGISAIRT